MAADSTAAAVELQSSPQQYSGFAALTAEIRNTIGALGTWGDSKDATDSGGLRLFANKIDARTKELAFHASVLLDEFEIQSSSPAGFGDLDDVALLGDIPPYNESSPALMQGAVGESRLKDVQDEVAAIESWEVEAEKLAAIAVTAFHNLKNETESVREIASSEATAELKSEAAEIHNSLHADQSEMKQELNSYVSEAWTEAGYEVMHEISSEVALETIVNLPLKTYKLRDDKQRDLSVRSDEKRTRYHVGVLGRDARLEPSSIFSFNIGAVSQLATSFERILSKLAASSSFIRNQAPLKERLSALSSQTENKGVDQTFKSPSQLASEVAALETEAALTRIVRLSQSVIASARVNLVNSRFISQLKSTIVRSQSSERVGVVERDALAAREKHSIESEAYLDQLLIHLEAVDKMRSAWNSTRREQLELEEAAKTEAQIAREEIHAEASVEREHESATLEQIQLVGKARVDEIIHVVESIFWHLAGAARHTLTPEGRQMFLFYSVAAAVLAFVVSTSKELLALGCTCILRIFTAPRLVREYGNLRMQVKWRTKSSKQAMDDAVLPSDIKDRIHTIVNVASAASRRKFPLRSVLVYGQPGTGKSLVAKAIAQSIPSLPFALLSGVDVYPMGSQGPAELRRLLTWASKSRHGGIIIIDEAESALGSRSKAQQDKKPSTTDESSSPSPGYSRDCLNVLLSMTGSCCGGKIMLILTTTNPGDLDEAVLDRMDEIIHLPMPSQEERTVLLNNQFSRLFEQLNDDRPSLASRILFRLAPLSRRSRAPFDSHFDAEKHIADLAADSKTNGFSGRELDKLLKGIMHKTYASDRGILDATLWKKESDALIKSVAAKHLLALRN